MSDAATPTLLIRDAALRRSAGDRRVQSAVSPSRPKRKCSTRPSSTGGVARALADPDRLRYWVAEIGSPAQLVGQAAITREWSDWRNGWIWWLQSVYVAEPYRGRGVFRALYRHIRDEARADPDVIGLRLYVEDANQPAQRTYQVAGHEARRILGLRGALARSSPR